MANRLLDFPLFSFNYTCTYTRARSHTHICRLLLLVWLDGGSGGVGGCCYSIAIVMACELRMGVGDCYWYNSTCHTAKTFSIYHTSVSTLLAWKLAFSVWSDFRLCVSLIFLFLFLFRSTVCFSISLYSFVRLFCLSVSARMFSRVSRTSTCRNYIYFVQYTPNRMKTRKNRHKKSSLTLTWPKREIVGIKSWLRLHSAQNVYRWTVRAQAQSFKLRNQLSNDVPLNATSHCMPLSSSRWQFQIALASSSAGRRG